MEQQTTQINMVSFNPTTFAKRAQKLRALHIPGNPLLLTNVWDAPSTALVLAHPETKAIATASFAVAAVAGLHDEELTMEDNYAAASKIAARIEKEGKAETIPLTVDLQDGYGERLGEAVEKIIRLGVVGCNLEDSTTDVKNGKVDLINPEEHAARIRKVMIVAAKMGVPDFVVNARTDCVKLGGTVEEAVRRGRMYLEAGATTVFVWGGMNRGLRDEEVRELVKGLDGKVNVIYRKSVENALGVKGIAELGVARISMGPGLWTEAMAAAEKEMGRILSNGTDFTERF